MGFVGRDLIREERQELLFTRREPPVGDEELSWRLQAATKQLQGLGERHRMIWSVSSELVR